MMMRNFIAAGLLLSVSSVLSTQNAGALKRFEFAEYHMGVDARIVVYASDKPQAEKACRAAFDRIATLDWIMSDYRKDSELMKLCDIAGRNPVKVSPDLFKVLERSMEISKRSGGAFDITVGPVVALWRKARKSVQLPTPEEIRIAKKLVGWQRVLLNRNKQTVKFTAQGIRLDLGGIAKGYASDEAQKVLRRYGVSRALVEMGGDLVVTGPPSGAKGWKVRVPNAGEDQGPKDMEFANCAISTSGDTEQFVVIGGVQYSHVVDARTGWALTNRVQATVIAKDGLTSDPLSTALTVLGVGEREKFLKEYGAKSYVKVISK